MGKAIFPASFRESGADIRPSCRGREKGRYGNIDGWMDECGKPNFCTVLAWARTNDPTGC